MSNSGFNDCNENIEYCIEGESVDDLDLDDNDVSDSYSTSVSPYERDELFENFPREPCFSEFDENDILVHRGPLTQIQTLTNKSRYGILFKDKFVIFKKLEEKVSKFQIPIYKIKNLSRSDFSNEVKCEFKLETDVKTFKFQCLKKFYEDWKNAFKSVINNETFIKSYLLMSEVRLQDVKGYRIFTLEDNYTVAYYYDRDYFDCHIPMHRIKMKSSGVKKNRDDGTMLQLRTSYRNYVLKFHSASDCQLWHDKLSDSIYKAISEMSLSKTATSVACVIQEINANESNKLCAECDKNEAKWASINLFITLCKECSGFHRSVSSFSRIQSIEHDEKTWKDKTLIELFKIIGNNHANEFWMWKYKEKELKEVSKNFLIDKYKLKKYVDDRTGGGDESINDLLIDAVKKNDVLSVMKYYHLGGDVDYRDANSNTAYEIAKSSGDFKYILKFFDYQKKNVTSNWRKEYFDKFVTVDKLNSYSEKKYKFSVNNGAFEMMCLEFGAKILIFNPTPTLQLPYVNIEDMSLVSKVNDSLEYNADDKSSNSCDLLLILKDTLLNEKESIDTIKVKKIECDSELNDLKNILVQKMCPFFKPNTSFDCAAWIILSTAEEKWKPYLLILQCNRILHFFDPMESEGNGSFQLDLRKVKRIEEQNQSKYESTCSYDVYNLDSICLFSSVIYHIRSDTKSCHKALLDILNKYWTFRDCTLANQILTQSNVPLAVHKMTEYLQITATCIEGPFRRVGRVAEAEKIYKNLMEQPDCYRFTDQDPYDVSSAFKIYFRRLSEPLLTKKLYTQWLAASKIYDKNEKYLKYKYLIQELPKENYQTFRQVIFLLVNIVKNNKETQMNPNNLSTSFSSCFLVTEKDNIGFNNEVLNVLPYIIENYENLFDVTQEELKREENIRHATGKINNPPQTTVLREICVDDHLKDNIRKEANLQQENDKKYLFKQVPINGATKVHDIEELFFQSNLENIILFEEREIDSNIMEKLIYPIENLFDVIKISDKIQSRCKQNCYRRFIFRKNTNNISFKIVKHDNVFRSLAEFNRSNVMVEITDTNQLNIWKDQQQSDIICNLSIKNVILYRMLSRKMVAFDDKSLGDEKRPNNVQKILHYFKGRSNFNFITFQSENFYIEFLKFFDQAKMFELTPLGERPGIAKIIQR